MRRYRILQVLALLLAFIALVNLLLGKNAAQKSTPDKFLDKLMEMQPFPTDSSLLYDLKNFSYVIEPIECSDQKLFAILLITSHSGHSELRYSHRRGYPKADLAKLGIRRVFLLASPPLDSVWQQGAVDDEARQFNDVLQGNFVEAYRHLTYKNTMGLMWAARKCGTTIFTIKMDDDVAVNLYELVKLMHKEVGQSYLRLAGMKIQGARPIRNPESKWFMTQEEFPGDALPEYLSGWLYFGRTGLLGRLAHNASATMPYLFIDDLLLLGIVREKILGKELLFLDIVKRFSLKVHCCVQKPKLACPFIAGTIGRDDRLMVRFIQNARKCSKPNVCQPPLKELDACLADGGDTDG